MLSMHEDIDNQWLHIPEVWDDNNNNNNHDDHDHDHDHSHDHNQLAQSSPDSFHPPMLPTFLAFSPFTESSWHPRSTPNERAWNFRTFPRLPGWQEGDGWQLCSHCFSPAIEKVYPP